MKFDSVSENELRFEDKSMDDQGSPTDLTRLGRSSNPMEDPVDEGLRASCGLFKNLNRIFERLLTKTEISSDLKKKCRELFEEEALFIRRMLDQISGPSVKHALNSLTTNLFVFKENLKVFVSLVVENSYEEMVRELSFKDSVQRMRVNDHPIITKMDMCPIDEAVDEESQQYLSNKIQDKAETDSDLIQQLRKEIDDKDESMVELSMKSNKSGKSNRAKILKSLFRHEVESPIRRNRSDNLSMTCFRDNSRLVTPFRKRSSPKSTHQSLSKKPTFK